MAIWNSGILKGSMVTYEANYLRGKFPQIYKMKGARTDIYSSVARTLPLNIL